MKIYRAYYNNYLNKKEKVPFNLNDMKKDLLTLKEVCLSCNFINE